eukprot:TRINITY_DN5886_c0_g2_i1.p1 TRINITY_DN5886_c0_g2~~TRINITY_DN5886_c0_g2_i1.p1  ORF type:complete len:85 (+),score=3.47 TRINITY_DN5886_c0_g2_i1:79-333(+)
MKVNCLFFAQSKEIVGVSELEFEIEEGTTSKVFLNKYLLTKFPELNIKLPTFLFAINQEYIDREESIVIKPNSELAVIPPVSGG